MRFISNRFHYFVKPVSKHFIKPFVKHFATCFKYGLLLLLLSTTVACTRLPWLSDRDTSTGAVTESQAIAEANIVGTALAPKISGQVKLVETPSGLEMQGEFVNVPAGMHGFHIHEGGSCAKEGGEAGGHFNPRQVEHGHLPSVGFEYAHAGDFGNLLANATGVSSWNLNLPGLTLTSGDYAVANRTFILHAKPDDLGQPTGNAGDRIACGIIQLVAQEAPQGD